MESLVHGTKVETMNRESGLPDTQLLIENLNLRIQFDRQQPGGVYIGYGFQTKAAAAALRAIEETSTSAESDIRRIKSTSELILAELRQFSLISFFLPQETRDRIILEETFHRSIKSFVVRPKPELTGASASNSG